MFCGEEKGETDWGQNSRMFFIGSASEEEKMSQGWTHVLKLPLLSLWLVPSMLLGIVWWQPSGKQRRSFQSVWRSRFWLCGGTLEDLIGKMLRGVPGFLQVLRQKTNNFLTRCLLHILHQKNCKLTTGRQPKIRHHKNRKVMTGCLSMMAEFHVLHKVWAVVDSCKGTRPFLELLDSA